MSHENENEQPRIADADQSDGAPPAQQHSGPTVVGIGASAGGLAALKAFFAKVPADSQLAFVVVVHLSPEHESHLSDLLRTEASLPVEQITQDTPLKPGHVYVIPPACNLNSIDSHLRLSEMEPDRAQRAPIDHFFRTLAATNDGNSIGVILTGTGTDGTLGIREIKARGGLTVVQAPNEAEYDGMPQSAISTGMIDLVLPIAEIPDAIARYVQVRPRLSQPGEDGPGEDGPGEDGPGGDGPGENGQVDADDQQSIRQIFNQLRTRTGRDFSRYKRSTILRRIARRMQLRNVEEIDEYLEVLQQHPDEVTTLADDMLITVTNFFRDPLVFERLEKHIIPELLKHKTAEDDFRVWSVGCATGEEPYSLAMLLIEATAHLDSPPRLHVFASDMHEQSLVKARSGIYTSDIQSEVNPQRLKRFFHQENGGFRICNEVRELVVFVPHNLLGDPPFSKLDLITCRNVMIYLQRDVQRDVIDLFHYSLLPDGGLVLGTSETIDASELFRADDKKLAIYRRRNVPAPETRLPVFPLSHRAGRVTHPYEKQVSSPTEYRALHHSIVERYGPPSVLITPDDKAVYLAELAGRFLNLPGGEITQNIFKLAREELRMELRAVVHDARKQNTVQHSRVISITREGQPHQVVMSAYPVLGGDHDGFVLLVFDEREKSEPQDASLEFQNDGEWQHEEPAASAARLTSSSESARADELQAELDTTRNRMQGLVEEYDTTREEMKASNEELQSSNEELRSTMEELETSKEELQSMNEELRTLDQENRHRLDELKQLSGDLQNLLTSTNVATLFLDRELRIVWFTPKVGELFSIQTADRGRSLGDYTSQLGNKELLADAKQVLKLLVPITREVCDEQGRWYASRVSPYRSTDDRIEGVVLTFVDFSDRRKAEKTLRQTQERLEVALEAAQMGIWELDIASGMAQTNTRHNQIFGHSAGDIEWGLEAFKRQLLPEDLPVFDVAFESALRTGVLEVEFRIRWPDGSVHWVYDRGRVAFEADGQPRTMSGVTLETTEHRRFEQRYRSLFESIDEGFCMIEVLFDENDKPVDFQYLEANVAFETHSGLTDAVGKKASELMPELEEHWFEIYGRVAKTGTSERFTHRAASLNNSDFDVFAFRIDEPGENHVALLFENVTERMDFERSLKKAKRIADEANRSRGDFLANMSHEIRTPMTAILGHADILAEQLTDTGHLASLETIRRNGGFLLEIINDILDLSKIDAGHMQVNIEPARLDILLGDVARLMELKAKEKSLELHFEFDGKLPRVIETDLLRLRQILVNLIGNAIKFTSEGSIRIVIRYLSKTEPTALAAGLANGTNQGPRPEASTDGSRENELNVCQIQFDVIDTGIGISPEQIARLFQPFVQADASLTRQYGGTGLGLTISGRLAQSLGGNLSVRSVHGEGSTFTVVVDCGNVDDNVLEELQVVAPEPAIKPTVPVRLDATIVVVDDRRDIRFLAQHFIERSGGTVVTADNGLDAIELIARRLQNSEPVDAVLMDMQMPVMDGYEAARTLRERGFTAPIIALTANAMSSDRDECLQAGCTDHLPKPIDGHHLIQLIAKHLSSAGQDSTSPGFRGSAR